MAAYRRVYDSPHLQADCQVPGISPGTLRSAIEYGLPFYLRFYSPCHQACLHEFVLVHIIASPSEKYCEQLVRVSVCPLAYLKNHNDVTLATRYRHASSPCGQLCANMTSPTNRKYITYRDKLATVVSRTKLTHICNGRRSICHTQHPPLSVKTKEMMRLGVYMGCQR